MSTTMLSIGERLNALRNDPAWPQDASKIDAINLAVHLSLQRDAVDFLDPNGETVKGVPISAVAELSRKIAGWLEQYAEQFSADNTPMAQSRLVRVREVVASALRFAKDADDADVLLTNSPKRGVA